MPCFGGVFRHWLRDLGGLGDSGGGQSLRSNGVLIAPAIRSSSRRMLTSRSPERPRLSVESLWVPAGQYPLGSAGIDATMSVQLATGFVNQKHP